MCASIAVASPFAPSLSNTSTSRCRSSPCTYALKVERFTRQAYQSGIANKASTSTLSAMYASANLAGEKRKSLIICVTYSASAESAYARVKTNEGRAAFAQLPQKLLRRNEERVLQEDTTDQDHRMRPHDVHDEKPTKLGAILSVLVTHLGIDDMEGLMVVLDLRVVTSELVAHCISIQAASGCLLYVDSPRELPP